jgi:hypothetical protein
VDLSRIEAILLAGFSFVSGTFFGGLVQARVSEYGRFKEARGIAKALWAEISSIRRLVESRDYVRGLDLMMGRISDPSHEILPEDVFSVMVRQDYMEVFHACAPKIGLLGGLSEGVVLLYAMVKAVLEDMALLSDFKQSLIERKPLPVRSGNEREAILTVTNGMRAWMAAALQQAPIIEAQLETFSSNRFRWWSFKND